MNLYMATFQQNISVGLRSTRRRPGIGLTGTADGVTMWPSLWHGMSNVFLNRFLHVLAYGHGNVDVVLVVDTEGNSWRTIPVPQGYDDGFIGHS